MHNDFEGALVHLFPAIDKTGKLRRSKDGVGARIKSFLADEEDIISVTATNILMVNNVINGFTFPEAMYKFGRTSIMHEGELDPRLIIGEGLDLSLGHVWQLPATYVLAMAISVITAPENKNEFFIDNKIIHINDKNYRVNDLWGKSAKLRKDLNIP
ncbi:hypothetical protein D3M71_11190 [Erwinia billingiae]|nr:hypothetical protein [Erwinia billingiae]